MTRLRWGDAAPTDAAAARERLIDAAERCIDRFGLAKTTLEDVAAEASVSRATIYRYFGNRDELMLEVLLRELERSFDVNLDAFVQSVRTPSELAAAIVDASAYLLATIRNNAKLQLLLRQDGPSVAATVAGASKAFFDAIADDLRPYLEPAQAAGLLRADLDLAEASEWILRSILSLLTVEGPIHRTPDNERRFLASYLTPALVPSGEPVPVTAPATRVRRKKAPS
ncbi:MAG: TetR/AcrR family transcriptional regulator [Actinobacteria bacterium]|nr:TetR/AcrR family transcriptional regulator [Actinomycetota bacterium]